MFKTKADKLLSLAARRQLVTAADAAKLGIPRTYLPRLAYRGQLERIARGLYTSPAFFPTEHGSLVEALYQVSNGILCLLSALRFHNLTTQSPHEVWVAIEHRAWKPNVSSPPIRFVRMSGPALQFGVSEHHVSGAAVHVFTPAKTIADCFKFRNKIGLDVAIEGLKESRRLKKASMDEIWAAAKVCRVSNVIRPYLESL